jgi:hypothetical protein
VQGHPSEDDRLGPNPKRLGICYTPSVPTVLRFAGLRVVIYFNDHRPAHVHVIGRGHEALFNLRCPAGPVELRENYGFSRRDVADIEAVLLQSLADLCRAWEELHGTTR